MAGSVEQLAGALGGGSSVVAPDPDLNQRINFNSPQQNPAGGGFSGGPPAGTLYPGYMNQGSAQNAQPNIYQQSSNAYVNSIQSALGIGQNNYSPGNLMQGPGRRSLGGAQYRPGGMQSLMQGPGAQGIAGASYNPGGFNSLLGGQGANMMRGSGYNSVDPQLMRGTGANMLKDVNYQPGLGNLMQGPGRQHVGQTQNIAAYMQKYMNPYTDEVIDNTMNDLERQRQIMQGRNAADAAAAGAFGGSRHGLVEATTNADISRQMGTQAAQLRESGFNTAAALADRHVQNRMDRGRTLFDFQNQNQQNKMQNSMNRAQVGLQQGQALGNLQSQNLQLRMQDRMNQSGQGLALGQALSGLQAGDQQRRIQDAQLRANFGLQQGQALLGAQNQNQQNRMQSAMNRSNTALARGQALGSLQNQNINNQMGWLQQQDAALGARSGLLSQLAQQGMDIGNTMTDRQMRNAQGMNNINQALMDQQRQMYDQYLNSPMQAYAPLLDAINGNPLSGNRTQTGTVTQPGPGLLGYLGAGMQAGSQLYGKK